MARKKKDAVGQTDGDSRCEVSKVSQRPEMRPTPTLVSTTTKIESVNNLGLRRKVSLMRARTNDHEVLWQPNTGIQKRFEMRLTSVVLTIKTRRKVKLTPGNILLFAYGSKTPLVVSSADSWRWVSRD